MPPVPAPAPTLIGPRDRKLDDLDPRFKLIVFELLARLTEAGILVMIIETRRTEAQHQADLASGHSWIARSLHQDGLAIDLCPYLIYQEVGADKLQWLSTDPVWQRLGSIGEGLGLRWGGRWSPHGDMGHLEFVPLGASSAV